MERDIYHLKINSKSVILTTGVYAGRPILLACDHQCHKAWGWHTRPRIINGQPMTHEEAQAIAYEGEWHEQPLALDSQLGDAPALTGTWEGSDTKPRTPEERLNKWCCRECERSRFVSPSETDELPNFTGEEE